MVRSVLGATFVKCRVPSGATKPRAGLATKEHSGRPIPPEEKPQANILLGWRLFSNYGRGNEAEQFGGCEKPWRCEVEEKRWHIPNVLPVRHAASLQC
jgi:hypothetical protein